MTWPRTRTRAYNTSHVKQESMGIGANAAARIDRDYSLCHAAIEKELRNEVAVREKRRRELDFLEKGGDPLDFEFGDVVIPSQLSTASLLELLSLSDSDPRLKDKLHFLQKQVATESRKGLDVNPFKTASNVTGHLPSDGVGSPLIVNRNIRNGKINGGAAGIARVKEERHMPPSSLSETEASLALLKGTHNSTSPKTLRNTAPEVAETLSLADTKQISDPLTPAIPAAKSSVVLASERVESLSATGPAERKESISASGTSEVRASERKENLPASGASEVLAPGSALVAPDSNIRKGKLAGLPEDQILSNANSIKAARESAGKKPLPGPPRRKSHWDFVLEEMSWMANDFMQERLWKTAAAAQASTWAADAFAKRRMELPAHNNEVKLEKMDAEVDAPGSGDCGSKCNSPLVPDTSSEYGFAEETLHFLIPLGSSELCRNYVEQAWASTVLAYEKERSKQARAAEFVADDDFVASQLQANRNKRRKVGQSELSPAVDEFLDTRGPKRPRTAPFPGRRPAGDDDDFLARLKAKKVKSNKFKNLKKNTDSENEWLPDSCSSPEKTKRKKDHAIGNKGRTDEPSLKRRLPNVTSTGDRVKRACLLKADFFQVSVNQPGDGIPWEMVEDQAILALEHDFGANWEFLSDVVNTSYHIKGHYRSPLDCKERHALLIQNLAVNRSMGDHSLPGIPKGSAMLLLQRLQGPMEEDTLKVHFEQLIKAKTNCVVEPKVSYGEGLDPSHPAFKPNQVVLSPLDFIAEIWGGPQQEDGSLATQNQMSNGCGAASRSSNGSPGFPSAFRLGSHDDLEDVKPQKDAAEEVTVPKQAEEQQQQQQQQQQHQQQKAQQQQELRQQRQQQHLRRMLSQKQRAESVYAQQPTQAASERSGALLDQKASSGQEQKPLLPLQQQQQHFNSSSGHPRQSFHQGTTRKPGLVQQQQHMPSPSQQQQHMPSSSQQQPTFPTSRPLQADQSFQYPRSFSATGPRMQVPSMHHPHWRPAQAAATYSNGQRPCVPQSAPPDTPAAVFQHFQNPALNPRSKQHRPVQQQAQQQQQQQQQQGHAGVPFMPGAVRPFQSFARGPYRPVYTSKPWQQQQQPPGGGPAFCPQPERRPVAPTATDTMAAGSSSCK